MIHEIGRELQAKLSALGVGLPVLDGPEATATTTWGRERIVLQHDTDAKDSFGPVRSVHLNPKHRRTITDSFKLTIYVQARGAGTSLFEHRERGAGIREVVLVAMDYVAAARRNRWSPTSGQFITPDDLKDSEQANGAAYELKFTFDHPNIVQTFAGVIASEGLLAGVRSSTQVQRGAATDNDGEVTHEVACGA